MLLSVAVGVLSVSALAQNTKEQNKNLKSKNLSTSPLNKDTKEQNKEVKKDTTDWETKVIEELKLTDSQKEKLDLLNKEFNKKIKALKLSDEIGKEEGKELIEPAKVIKAEDKEKAEAVNVSVEITKEEMEKNEAIKQSGEMSNEGESEKMKELKKEKEVAFMKLLTPEQQAKYKEMLEKMNKEKETEAALKPIKKELVLDKVGEQ